MKTGLEEEERGGAWVVLGLGIASLAPLVLYHRMFSRLFWFGDEFDLIDQFDRMGFWKWTWIVFAENFVPVFKVLWGGAVFAFGGSYAAMIALVWATHALNVALLGRLMRVCGFSLGAAAFAQLVLGLSPGNLETMAWSVQWSAVLSVTFMLLALERFFVSPFKPAPVFLSAASALSFSRGVLTGVLLALVSLMPTRGREWCAAKRIGFAAACLLPALLVAGLIAILATGNQRHMVGHWSEAAAFGAWYYCLNPLRYLLSVGTWGASTTAVLGAAKLALVASAIACSGGNRRAFLVALLVFDVGNAALLGIGRYHTGLPAAISSRYQYASLLAVMPSAGFWLSRIWAMVPGPAALRSATLTAFLCALAIAMCLHWPSELGPFTAWRGTDSRRILLVEANPPPNAVPGIPGLPMDRARELIEKYHLH